MEEKPIIICLTPVKNEAWILDLFIQCASIWADYIIIADQMSTDYSREIALKYPKVRLVSNTFEKYNESIRQQLLIDLAREIPCFGRKKLFITLDADEFLTANFTESIEWQTILSSPVGTVIYFSWLNVKPDFKTYWQAGNFAWGFIDDGKSQHKGSLIHSSRIPIPLNSPIINCKEIKVLHYQYTDWRRMQSKHNWYQCFELLNRKHLHPLSIFRMYHHMYAITKEKLKPLDQNWFSYYEKQGIDMRNVIIEGSYWWDLKIEKYFQQYGKKHFSSLAIWHNDKQDPRSIWQKLIHRYLFKTQLYYKNRNIVGFFIRQFDKILKFLL